MKRVFSLLLAACLVLGLSACSQKGQKAPDQDSSAQVSSAQTDPDQVEAEAVIDGIVNRIGDFLVLLDKDGNYLIFDFGVDVDPTGLEEGDSVTVHYNGELGNEKEPPVAVLIEKTAN
jgi:predicted small lipoprotein YifL